MNRPRTAILIALLTLAGCGYGPVSPAAYDYSVALYGLANRQAAERLGTVAEQIDASLVNQQISAKEAEWLHDIIADAEAGKWEAAVKAARRMMEDQVDGPH